MRFLRVGRHDDEPLHPEAAPAEPVGTGDAGDDAGAADVGAPDAGAATPVEPVESQLDAVESPVEELAHAEPEAEAEAEADAAAVAPARRGSAGPWTAAVDSGASVDAVAVAAESADGDPAFDLVDERRSAHGEAGGSFARAEAAADGTGWLAGHAEDAEGISTEPVASVDASPARTRFSPLSDAAGESAHDPAAEGRAPALRFAGLHLRTGQHALARAELEALAGRGQLDGPGLLDLAEIRWRTGDLAGAGDAANAFLARGSESPLALVIAAEAVAAVGRPGEARRLSSRAI